MEIIIKVFRNNNLGSYPHLDRLIEHTRIDILKQCWIWTGSLNHGKHGIINIDKKSIFVHRLSASLFLNLDLNNKELQGNHKLNCNDMRCWNPDHIYVGTQFDNVQDSVTLNTHSKRPEKTHCIKGHEYTPENTYIYKNEKRCKICRLANQRKYFKRT